MLKRTDFYNVILVGLFIFTFRTEHYYFAAAFAGALILNIIDGRKG